MRQPGLEETKSWRRENPLAVSHTLQLVCSSRYLPILGTKNKAEEAGKQSGHGTEATTKRQRNQESFWQLSQV